MSLLCSRISTSTSLPTSCSSLRGTSRLPRMSVTCATKPLSTLKKLTVLYAPSLASFWMCADEAGATCVVD